MNLHIMLYSTYQDCVIFLLIISESASFEEITKYMNTILLYISLCFSKYLSFRPFAHIILHDISSINCISTYSNHLFIIVFIEFLYFIYINGNIKIETQV